MHLDFTYNLLIRKGIKPQVTKQSRTRKKNNSNHLLPENNLATLLPCILENQRTSWTAITKANGPDMTIKSKCKSTEDLHYIHTIGLPDVKYVFSHSALVYTHTSGSGCL